MKLKAVALTERPQSERSDMSSNGRNDENLNPTKRDILISEYLLKLGITNIEEAPDEQLEKAIAYADSILGVGNDN